MSSDQRCLLRALEITTKIRKEEVRKEIKLLGTSLGHKIINQTLFSFETMLLV